MVLATVSLILGIVLGLAVLAATRRGVGSVAQPPGATAAGWLTLVFGLVALVGVAPAVPAVGNAGWLPDLGPWPANLSILLSVAALVIGVGAMRRGERGWPTVVGLIAAVVPAAFWLWFALGYLLGTGG